MQRVKCHNLCGNEFATHNKLKLFSENFDYFVDFLLQINFRGTALVSSFDAHFKKSNEGDKY